LRESQWRIRKKKIALLNDRIPTMLDVHFLFEHRPVVRYASPAAVVTGGRAAALESV